MNANELATSAKDVHYNDIVRNQRIKVITDFESKCHEFPNKKKSDIAKDMHYSMSTLNRYKKELGYTSNRKVSNHTHEEKQRIQIKALHTRTRKEEIKSRRLDIYNKYKDGVITFDEFESQLSQLTDTLKVNAPDTQIHHKPVSSQSRRNIGGTMNDDDGPKTITEEELNRRISRASNRDEIKADMFRDKRDEALNADSLIQNSLNRVSGKLNS